MKFVDLQVNLRGDPILDRLFTSPLDGVWLIGGAGRSVHTLEPIKDYDFVFKDIESLKTFRDRLVSIGANKVSETKNHDLTHVICEDFVLRYGEAQREFGYIQVKYEFYDDPRKQFADTDFTICQFAATFGSPWTCVCSEQALADYQSKTLRLEKIQNPVATMNRIQNYIAKGYKPFSIVGFYGEVARQIRKFPEAYFQHSIKPQLKVYKKGWREEHNVPEVF